MQLEQDRLENRPLLCLFYVNQYAFGRRNLENKTVFKESQYQIVGLDYSLSEWCHLAEYTLIVVVNVTDKDSALLGVWCLLSVFI